MIIMKMKEWRFPSNVFDFKAIKKLPKHLMKAAIKDAKEWLVYLGPIEKVVHNVYVRDINKLKKKIKEMEERNNESTK